MFKTSTVAAALLAAAPFASAGSATIINNCKSDVHVWTADTVRGQLGPDVLNPGGMWAEQYYMVGTGSSKDGGVSIKLSTEDSCEGPITQFEYTFSSDGDPNLWYDISNVNCAGSECPFYEAGFYLEAPTVVSCGPLTAVCDAVYNVYNDDIATHGTSSSQDLTLYLCGQDGESSNSTTSNTTPSATPSSDYHAVDSTPVTSYIATTAAPIVELSGDVDVANLPVITPVASSVNVIVTQIETEYATAYATVYARSPKDSDVHMHQARAHQHGHPHWRR